MIDGPLRLPQDVHRLRARPSGRGSRAPAAGSSPGRTPRSSSTFRRARPSGSRGTPGPAAPSAPRGTPIEMNSGMRFVSCTHFAHFVIGFSISVWSMSCSAPISKRESGLRPPMISIGLLLCQALAIAVVQSVTPGPAVTTPTPQRRVARDQPSAACPATCSCRTSMTRTFSSMQRVVDRLHVPAAEREDRVDALLLDRAGDEVAAVYHGHGAAPSGSCLAKSGSDRGQ